MSSNVVKITELPVTSEIKSEDLLIINQDGETKTVKAEKMQSIPAERVIESETKQFITAEEKTLIKDSYSKEEVDALLADTVKVYVAPEDQEPPRTNGALWIVI